MIALSLFSLLFSLCFKLSYDGILKYIYVFKLSPILYPTTICCIAVGFTSILINFLSFHV